MIPVKNIGQGPQAVEGCGVLEHGQTGDAADTEHTRALIDAGHLLDLTDEPAPESRPRTRATAKEA
jgi:hypothetical protein